MSDEKVLGVITSAVGQYRTMSQWYSADESAFMFHSYVTRSGYSIVKNEVLDEAAEKAKRYDEQEKKVENDVTKAIDAAVGEYVCARYDVKLERYLAFVNSLSASGFVVTNSRKLAETMIKAEEHDDLVKKIEDMEKSIALLKIKAGAYDALVKLDIEDMARKAERYDELLKQASEQEVCCLGDLLQAKESERKFLYTIFGLVDNLVDDVRSGSLRRSTDYAYRSLTCVEQRLDLVEFQIKQLKEKDE